MDIFKRWREAGWTEVDSSVYETAYHTFGGSVITHPLIVKTMSDMTEMPLRYLGRYVGEELIGAIPVWGKYIAGNKSPLRRAGKSKMIDMGNAEVILPLNQQHVFNVRYRTELLSSLHQDNISRFKTKEESLSLLKSYSPDGEYKFSKKFKYNQRRELRLFEEREGFYKNISEFSSAEFSEIYIMLFSKRWKGWKPKGYERLPEWLDAVKSLHKGHVLFDKHHNPVAVQLLLLAESPQWISVEYINGGVDPEYKSMSVGSILSYINTKYMSEYSESKGKYLRFSFGKSDKMYKDLWCYKSPVLCI